ncbi:MAG: aminofutalosine synthase MqnE [Bacteroidota bacterium]|nr:aminofutalosine synthase MqnE [Bacteroidota bacterium]
MLNIDIPKNQIDDSVINIVEKILKRKRISDNEALKLYQDASLSLIASLANVICESLHEGKIYFNKNIHIEPTNICVFDCKFCSYSRLIKKKEEGWEYTIDEMIDLLEDPKNKNITEVHIVGGVHPKMGLNYFINLIQKIKKLRPDIHIKAFTAVELEYMCRKAKVSYKEGLTLLQKAGQGSLPGGGAEIFNKEIRNKICKDKCSSEQWLEIHETAHRLGMPSNATMLYGHIEEPWHLIDHMSRLRDLQDKTNGFNTFIPLKFKNQNNQMSNVDEASIITDMRVYSIARIYLDNFKHLKAYWPMIGRNTAQTLLAFGVNDIDGTIDDTTKIYSMAGAEEQQPSMTTKEMIKLIKDVNRTPVERDTLYNTIQTF